MLAGTSEHVRNLDGWIREAAWSEAPVLIIGESGVGKSAVARSIHARGPRRGDPFVHVPCRDLSRRDLELVLFGREALATEGEWPGRPGCFEAADGGTVFIAHATAVPEMLQSSLLSVIECGWTRRRGSSRHRPVNVRIMASAGEDVELALIDGTLREDLFYGLQVLRIDVPPLRDRRKDISHIARCFLNDLHREGVRLAGIDAEANAALESYGWPGNVRQLRAALRRAATAARGGVIRARHLPPEVLSDRDQSRPARVLIPVGTTLTEAERRLILATLEATDYNKTAAAHLLGIDVKTLRTRLKAYH